MESPLSFFARIGAMNQIGTPLPALSPQGGERVAAGRERGRSWEASLQRTVPALERCSRSLFLLLLKLLYLLLRQRVILFGGLFQQLHAGGFVLVHSIALQITQAQLILGRRRTFRRTFLLKLDCLTERFLFGLFRVSGRRRRGNRRVVGRGNRSRRRRRRPGCGRSRGGRRIVRRRNNSARQFSGCLRG